MTTVSDSTKKAVAQDWLLDALLMGESKEICDYLCEKAGKPRMIKKFPQQTEVPKKKKPVTVVDTKLFSCIAIAEDRSQCGKVAAEGTNYCSDHLKIKRYRR
jgi:hypothetical protein